MALLQDAFRRRFWVQMSTLMFINFAQGILLTAPFTLGVYMVRYFLAQGDDDGGPLDEQVVGQLTGVLAAVYSFAQFTTSLLWGILSNVVGRKPVILIGTIAPAVSMLGYGAAGSYTQAVAARALGGVLNGVSGTWKCMVGESGDPLVQGKMFSMMALAWGLGTTLGPLVGGVLSHPCDHTPFLPGCGPGELLQARPFFLPCAVCAAVTAAAALAAAVLLVETLPEEQRQRHMSNWMAHATTVRLLVWASLCGPTTPPLAPHKDINPQLLSPAASMQHPHSLPHPDHDFARDAGPEPSPRHDVVLELAPLPPPEWLPGPKARSAIEQSDSLLPSPDPGNTLPCSTRVAAEQHGRVHEPCALPGSGASSSAKTTVRQALAAALLPFKNAKGLERGRLGTRTDEEATLLLSPSLALPQSGLPVKSARTATTLSEPPAAVMLERRVPGAWYQNRQILLTLTGYGLTVFLFCAMDELLPIFAAAPISEGGLAMSERQLASALTLFGVGLMMYSVFGYPPMQRAVGTVRLLCWGLVGAIATCMVIPFAHMAQSMGHAWPTVMLYISQLIKAVAQTAAFTGMMVAMNAAPHRSQLGTINGIGQAISSLVRGLAPLLGGLMWSVALSLHIPGQQFVPFVITSAVAAGALATFRCVYLPDLQ